MPMQSCNVYIAMVISITSFFILVGPWVPSKKIAKPPPPPPHMDKKAFHKKKNPPPTWNFIFDFPGGGRSPTIAPSPCCRSWVGHTFQHVSNLDLLDMATKCIA